MATTDPVFLDAHVRLIVKSLGISCDALLRKMDRLGKTPGLIEEYEKMDALLLKFRQDLLERVRAQ